DEGNVVRNDVGFLRFVLQLLNDFERLLFLACEAVGMAKPGERTHGSGGQVNRLLKLRNRALELSGFFISPSQPHVNPEEIRINLARLAAVFHREGIIALEKTHVTN